MRVDEIRWRSPNTGIEMPLRRLGDRGTPVVYVPSSGGDHTEFERYGMHRVCAPGIVRGSLQVVAVDGRGPQTLWNDRLDPPARIRAYAAVERYVGDEVVPWLTAQSGVERVVIVGASYGAFVAANLLLKRPQLIDLACGLGGVYGLWHRLDGHHDDVVRDHTPLDYLPHLDDAPTIHAIRATRGLDLFAAADDEWLESSIRLRRQLRERGLPHTCEVWPSPANHHERWWRRQLARFLARRL